jgi:predicted nucleic acid-binding protein
LAIIALDTNILAYAEGVRKVDGDDAKMALARALITELEISDHEMCIPAQVLAELHHVLRRKARLEPKDASARVNRYAESNRVAPTDQQLIDAAFVLANEHGLQTYDAIILAAAAQEGCSILYSEDMQHGFEWNGAMVINPFR